jgi:GNAT superfamily N-acetyltransferase
MNLGKIKIIHIDRAFKESERLIEFFNLRRTAWAELDPDTLSLSFENYKKDELKDEDKLWETKTFACEYEGKLICTFWLYGIREESEAPASEKDAGYFQCFVQKEYRRQGIASMMMREIAKLAKKWGMKKISCGGCEKEPAKEFCRNYGGEVASYDIERKFKLSDANWEKIEKYSQPTSNNADFSIELFDENPKDQKEEYFRLRAKIFIDACAFKGELDHDEDFFVKEMKEEDKKPPEDKDKLIVALTKTPEGCITGLTNIYIDRHIPSLCYQGITGVAKEHRGKGLGLRLKAVTALHIRNNFPLVETITTYTSNENSWMADINEAMDFLVTSKNEMYRFDVEELGRKLGFV